MDSVTQLRDLVYGYQVSQAIHVAAVLGLSDLLADGPRTTRDLAASTSAHEPSLARLMRALAEIDVYERRDDGRYALTELGAALRSRGDGRVDGLARNIGQPSHWQAWSGLEHSVRTGENAFVAQHGVNVWEHRAQHPEEAAVFDAAMTSGSMMAGPALLAAYDFAGIASLVDVGGGRGSLLAAILTAYSTMRGTLFDLPHVVATADGELRSGALSGRCDVVGGDAFESVPDGREVYLLRAVIHDWEDTDAVAILRSCRRAVRPAGRLLLVERVVGEGEPIHRKTTAFSDLNMLVLPGGRERTRSEYAELLAAADFSLARVVPTATGGHVIEAVPG